MKFIPLLFAALMTVVTLGVTAPEAVAKEQIHCGPFQSIQACQRQDRRDD